MKRALCVLLVVLVPGVVLAGDGPGFFDMFINFFYNGDGYRMSNEAGQWITALKALFIAAAGVGLGIIALRFVVQMISAGLTRMRGEEDED